MAGNSIDIEQYLYDSKPFKNVHMVDGRQENPKDLVTTNFQQDYVVIIRKKKYYAITASQGENAYLRMYQINNYSSASISMNVFSRPGNCSVSVIGGQQVICAEHQGNEGLDVQSKFYGNTNAGFQKMLNDWVQSTDDSDASNYWKGGTVENILNTRESKFGWRIAEKCDWEPMDEIRIYGKTRDARIGTNGPFSFVQLFFGYISDVRRTYDTQNGTVINISAVDHLKLLDVSRMANSRFALAGKTTFSGAHYSKDFAGNFILDDANNAFGQDLGQSMATEVFAGYYPYEIVIKCCRDAGIPDSYLGDRIELIKRVPFLYALRDVPAELFYSDLQSRLNFCSEAASKLYLEFFADEEGQIVLKIPNYTLGVNRLPKNNCHLNEIAEKTDIQKLNDFFSDTYKVSGYKTTKVKKTVKTDDTYYTVVNNAETFFVIAKKLGIKNPYNLVSLNPKYNINSRLKKGTKIKIKAGQTTTKMIDAKVPITKTYTKTYDSNLSTVTDKYIPTIFPHEIISFTLTDSDADVCNMFEVQSEVPAAMASAQAVQPLMKRAVSDLSSIIRFGMRPASSGTINTPLLQGEIGAVLFGTLLIQRTMSLRFKGVLDAIDNPSIRIGDPIKFFVYDDYPYIGADRDHLGVFYVESIDRTISPTGVSKMRLSLSAGRIEGMQSIYDKWMPLYKYYFTENKDNVQLPTDTNDILKMLGSEDITVTDTTSSPTKDNDDNGGGNNNPDTNSTQIKKLFTYANKIIGTPYVYGGTTIGKGIDCSGFVAAAFRSVGINLPRTSQAQYNYCIQKKYARIINPSQLEPGDILFFAGSYGTISSPGHVGLYAGRGAIINLKNVKFGKGNTQIVLEANSPYVGYRSLAGKITKSNGTKNFICGFRILTN